jgi:DNA-binding MarR family transcriptional regulator
MAPTRRSGSSQARSQRDQQWLNDLTTAITSVTTKAHSMQLYEVMGMNAKTPLRPYLFGVLSRVRDLQPARVSDVAKQMDYERSTVSRHITELVNLGCLKKSADPEDGRAVMLQLTPKGRAIIDRVYDAWFTSLSAITKGWSQSDQAMLLTLLGRFDGEFTAYVDSLIAPRKEGSKD